MSSEGEGVSDDQLVELQKQSHELNYFDRLLFAIVHILRTFLTFSYYLEFAKY